MRTTLLWASCLAVALSALSLSTAAAQNQPPAARTAPPAAAPAAGGSSAAAQHGIAVVDINYILEKYARFQGDVDAWKRDYETIGTGLKKEEEAITKQAENLKGLKPNTPDYKKLEESLAKRSSDLKVNASIKEKELLERRSQVFLAAYRDITAAVKAYADRSGISLVLQFNGAPVDQNNQRAVQTELSKLVVYQNGIDITPMILDELNRRAPVVGARPPAAGAPRKQ